jgi:hypothetical protein
VTGFVIVFRCSSSLTVSTGYTQAILDPARALSRFPYHNNAPCTSNPSTKNSLLSAMQTRPAGMKQRLAHPACPPVSSDNKLWSRSSVLTSYLDLISTHILPSSVPVEALHCFQKLVGLIFRCLLPSSFTHTKPEQERKPSAIKFLHGDLFETAYMYAIETSGVDVSLGIQFY